MCDSAYLAVPLIFGLHGTCVFSYLFEPLNELTLIYYNIIQQGKQNHTFIYKANTYDEKLLEFVKSDICV